MTGSLTNKVAVVTGASKGIGAGIAKKLALAGAKVVVNYSSDKEAAEAVVAEIVNKGGVAMAIQGSVTDAAAMHGLFEQVKSAYGDVGILVNNAGVYDFAPVTGVTEASYRRMVDTNIWGVIVSVQQALKAFDAAGGSIINISSFAGPRPEPYSVIYGASKYAVDSITTSLAAELGTRNIRVNSIRPGGVFTEGVAKLGATEDSESIRQMVARTPLGRMATPGDIGDLAVFLGSDASSVITGQFIEVSGGFK